LETYFREGISDISPISYLSDFPNEIKPQINELFLLTIEISLKILPEDNLDMLTALSRILTGSVPYYKGGKESRKDYTDDEYVRVPVGCISGVFLM
jgi:hypothetical protein